MAPNLVALILGYGPGIGASVAKKFASNGYKVAVASRSGNGSQTAEGFLSLKADFTQPDSIPALFDIVKSEFQAAPSVVVYNAAVRTPPLDKDNVFTTPTEAIVSDLNINTVSPYVAAQQATKEWEALPKELKKTFIYTGNILNTVVLPSPMMMTLGMGKSASAYWIGVADAQFSAQGSRQVPLEMPSESQVSNVLGATDSFMLTSVTLTARSREEPSTAMRTATFTPS